MSEIHSMQYLAVRTVASADECQAAHYQKLTYLSTSRVSSTKRKLHEKRVFSMTGQGNKNLIFSFGKRIMFVGMYKTFASRNTIRSQTAKYAHILNYQQLLLPYFIVCLEAESFPKLRT